MAASKTGLDEYRSAGKSVFAAKILSVEDYIGWPKPGAKRITFLRPSGTVAEANLLPEWVEQNNPQVGGYFIVEDRADGSGLTQARFVSDATKFERESVKVTRR